MVVGAGVVIAVVVVGDMLDGVVVVIVVHVVGTVGVCDLSVVDVGVLVGGGLGAVLRVVGGVVVGRVLLLLLLLLLLLCFLLSTWLLVLCRAFALLLLSVRLWV